MIKIFKPVGLGALLAVVMMVAIIALPASVSSIANGLDFSGTPTSGNAPLTVEFHCDYDDGYYGYSWDFGDGNTSSEQCPTHTYECAGVYDVTLCVEYVSLPEIAGYALAAVDGHEVTKEEYITVYPVAAFTTSPTMGIAPLDVRFRDESIGCPTDWHWNFGDGQTSNVKNPIHTYTEGGTYTVSLTVSGSPSDTVTKLNIVIVEDQEAPPKIVIRDLSVTPTYAEPRQKIQVNAKVVNEGRSWGSGSVEMLINRQFEQSATVGLAPGTAKPVSFTVYKVPSGEYQVTIGDATTTFYVLEEQEQSAPSSYGPLDTGGIIAIVVIGIILVGGVVLIFLFTRQT